MKKRSEVLGEEMEALRAEIKLIEENEEATDEDLTRSEALLSEWDEKKTLHAKAVDREAQVEEVLRARLIPDRSEREEPNRGPG